MWEVGFFEIKQEVSLCPFSEQHKSAASFFSRREVEFGEFCVMFFHISSLLQSRKKHGFWLKGSKRKTFFKSKTKQEGNFPMLLPSLL